MGLVSPCQANPAIWSLGIVSRGREENLSLKLEKNQSSAVVGKTGVLSNFLNITLDVPPIDHIIRSLAMRSIMGLRGVRGYGNISSFRVLIDYCSIISMKQRMRFTLRLMRILQSVLSE